jgi:hypothetical protein
VAGVDVPLLFRFLVLRIRAMDRRLMKDAHQEGAAAGVDSDQVVMRPGREYRMFTLVED